MSQQAEADRNRRRRWAALGGAHDRLVRTLQLGLPVIVGALAAVMVFAPFSERGQISFLVAKDSIEVAGQRIMVNAARYRGTDSRGRPFTLSADSAIQRSAADPVVRMAGVTGEIAMAEGPATLSAQSGRYDPVNDRLSIDGPLRFATSDGYQLETGNVLIDLKSRTARSLSPVSGRTQIGRFSANSMIADLNRRVVALHGNVRLRIDQRR